AGPGNTVLHDKYDELMAEYKVPDPQKVPEAILERAGAVPPEALLEAGFWRALVQARNRGLSRRMGWEPLRRALEQVGVSRRAPCPAAPRSVRGRPRGTAA